MTLENVFERSTIALPRPLSLDTAENLLSYLAKNLPARINYTASRIMYAMPDGSKQEGTASIGGMIARTEPFAVDQFESIPYREDTSKIEAIRFPPIPGYDLSEHDAGTVQLWDDVRGLITKAYLNLQS